MLYGTGKHTYELVDGWAKLPEGWSFKDVSSISVDSQDRVYVFSRGDHPVTVFDREGNLLTSWGEGFFRHIHGSHIGPDRSVYVTDQYKHTVHKFTPDGKLLLTMGNEDQPSDTGYVPQHDLYLRLASIKKGGPPFNCPTGVGVSSSGEIYVSDGYGNARVHKFAPDGTLLFSWGEPGKGPGQFVLPHHVWVDKQDRVWVCDRENNRIQFFNTQGEFLNQWADLSHPSELFIDKNEETVYVAEIIERRMVSIFTFDGKLLARWGSERGEDDETALFQSDNLGTADGRSGPHAIAVDSRGDIYAGEVRKGWIKVDRGNRALRKFVRRA